MKGIEPSCLRRVVRSGISRASVEGDGGKRKDIFPSFPTHANPDIAATICPECGGMLWRQLNGSWICSVCQRVVPGCSAKPESGVLS